MSSLDLTEGTVSPDSLPFTTSNWSGIQTVTVTGVNDDVQDGDQVYTIELATPSSSSDTNYQIKNPTDVTVTNTDNDTAGFTISSTRPYTPGIK